MNITEQLFTKTIEAIQKQFKKDADNAKHLNKVFPDAGLLSYDNNLLSDAIIALLREITADKDNWIEYFTDVLDFGAKNDRLKAWDKDGNIIPLSTPEELYIFLSNNFAGSK